MCARCGRLDNRPYQRHEAHHVCAIVDGGLPFDPANGEMLCVECHERETLAGRRARP